MVALLLDTSGSIRTDLTRIKEAAIDFVNHLHPKDAVSILTFSDDARMLQPLSVGSEPKLMIKLCKSVRDILQRLYMKR